MGDLELAFDSLLIVSLFATTTSFCGFKRSNTTYTIDEYTVGGVADKVFIYCNTYTLDFVLDEITKKTVSSLFKEYYKSFAPNVGSIERREFGFGDFEKKVSFRHCSFADSAALRRYLYDNAPTFVNYSISLYKDPAARPMENKGWLGAELVFDLDAGDLHLECQKRHGHAWVCTNCMDMVKAETMKLIEDFLIPDFGFSGNELSVNFSGNRGYHVHADKKALYQLTQKERRAITEYIAGINVHIETFFPTIGQKGKPLIGPKPADYGWGGRLARAMVKTLNGGTEPLQSLGIDQRTAKKLVANKADFIFGITTGNWDKIPIPKKAEFWEGVMKRMAISQGDSIDKNVTNDIYHLIRMPDTLHGDSGLVGKSVSISELASFDPLVKAIAFRKGSLSVVARTTEALVINNETYGPYNGEVVELPVYAALYLLLKRTATLSK